MNTRLWSLFEAFIFYLGYLASGLIARLGLLLFHATRLAIENQQNHALFDSQVFFNDVILAVESRPMLIVLLANLTVVLLYAIIIHARGEQVGRYIAFGPVPMRNMIGAVGAGIGFRYIFSILLALILRGSETLQSYNTHMTQMMNDDTWLILLAVVIAAPIVEEIIFRGVLFRALERSFHKGIAIIVPSILFALAHTDPVQMVYAFFLGLLFAFVRAKSGKLLPCILMHFAFNGANFLQLWDQPSFIPPLWLVLVLTCACYIMALYKKSNFSKSELH